MCDQMRYVMHLFDNLTLLFKLFLFIFLLYNKETVYINLFSSIYDFSLFLICLFVCLFVYISLTKPKLNLKF